MPSLRTWLWILIPALLLGACTGVPKGVTPVSGFDGDRYLGKWYEIARLDQRFERDLDNVTATYSKRSDGSIAVVNRGWNPKKGEWKDIAGRAQFIGDKTVGSLKVSFFWPIWAGYHVIALDPNYRFAMVSGPNKEYLWILSREKTLPNGDLYPLLDKARALGFDVNALTFVTQDRPDA